jgi:UDP-N-acetylglucosamine 2-epimerase (non-hydrolysing)
MPAARPRLKIALVYGTRPEIIKLSPFLRLFEKTKTPYVQIHSGQHYSPNMDKVFFDELELPEPRHKLRIQSVNNRQGDHVARMIQRVEEILYAEKPTHVLVQGDTNTVLAGALAAAKASTAHRTHGLKFRLCHVEAGLRSFDRDMPEEVNRVITDHLSDHLFVPTEASRRNALREGIDPARIFVTGNSVVDAVKQNLRIAHRKLKLASLTSEKKGRFILVTLHRQENVDDPARLKELIAGIEAASLKFGLRVVFPIHPRTRAKIAAFGIRLSDRFFLSEPVGYLAFLVLQSNAAIVLSDSGGLQEESCILKVPCVTLRTTTERPETIKAGANRLAGVRAADIVRSAGIMLKRPRTWSNPYGDGNAAERMLAIIRRGGPSAGVRKR